MSRVMTFSRTYPAYHPKAGVGTFFEYKIARSLWDLKLLTEEQWARYADLLAMVSYGHPPKHHTIRAGQNWKAGDWFSPRVWSGKPYNSKQIIFAPDIQVKKTWDFELHLFGVYNEALVTIDGIVPNQNLIPKVANNDGLTLEDFTNWFQIERDKPFIGQIICWNESIEY